MNPIDQAVILEEAKRYSDSKGGGVCLPVVEITSAAYPESGTVELSAEESVKLDAAVAEGFPVVVKMTIFGMPVAVVCTCLGGEMLNGFIVESSIGFAKDDTVWKMGEV